MKTGYSRTSSFNSDTTEHYETVSLCGVCDAEVKAEEYEKLVKGNRGFAWCLRVLGGVLGVRFLTLVHVPIPLAILIVLALMRLRLIGRALLVFWGIVLVEEVVGLNPKHHEVRVLVPWTIITGSVVAWRCWHAEQLLWPFGRLARGRWQARPIEVTATERPEIGGGQP